MRAKLAGLLFLCAASFFIGLGTDGISRSQEGRVLETAREMNERRDYLVPYLLGQPRYEKPPLLYWITAAGCTWSGRVNELAGRVPVALFGIGTVLLLYAIGRRRLTGRAGLFAGLALATGPLWVQFARLAETDVPQAFFVTLALFAFLEEKPLLAWITMGVGFLNKGPAALVVPLVTLIIWRCWSANGRALLNDCRWWHVLIGLSIGLGWYLAVLWIRQESISVFMVELGKLAVKAHERHRESFFYYFKEMMNFAPWSPVAVVAVPLAFRHLRRNPSGFGFSPSPATNPWTKVQTTSRDATASSETPAVAANAGLRFALTWFLATFVVLMLTRNKQRHYLIVLLPSCALMAGWLLDRLANWRTWMGPAIMAVCVVLAGANIYKCAVLDPRHSDAVVLRDFVRRVAATLRPGEELAFFDSAAYGRDLIALGFYSQRQFTTLDKAALAERLSANRAIAVVTTAGSLPAPLQELLRAKVGDHTWTFWRSP